MPQNITDVDEFTAVVQSPEDGDFADGAIFKLAPQALSNRTRNLKNRLDVLVTNLLNTLNIWRQPQIFSEYVSIVKILYLSGGAASEIVYPDPGPLRKVLVPLKPFSHEGWALEGASTSTAPAWILQTGSGTLAFTVQRDLIPSGALVTRVRACCRSSTVTGITVQKFTYDTSTPGGVSPGVPDVSEGAVFTPPFAQNFILDVATSKTLLNDRSVLRISLDTLPDGGTTLYWIEIEYTDPGPRNY